MKDQVSPARRVAQLLILLGIILAGLTPGWAGEQAQMEGKLLSGEKFSIEQWKGKVVMLNFWATWCGVCKSEMPDWQRLYDSNKAKGFQMLAVSIDDDEPEVHEFVARNRRYNFPVAWRFDKSEDDNFPTIRSTPTTVFIGKDGRIAETRKGAIPFEELDRIVKSLL